MGDLSKDVAEATLFEIFSQVRSFLIVEERFNIDIYSSSSTVPVYSVDREYRVSDCVNAEQAAGCPARCYPLSF